MAYHFPKKSKKERRTFDIALGDDVYSLPLIENLPMKHLVRVQAAMAKSGSRTPSKAEEGRVEMMQAFLGIFEDFAPAILDVLDQGNFEDLMEAWSKAGEEDLGES